MAIEVPSADEVCKNELFQYRRSRVAHCLCGHDRFYQYFRQHEISQPQSWKKNLGERADINNATFFVEPGKRLERWTVITIFAVVVILDNECPYTRSPLEKFKASRNGEDYAGRKLM